MPRVGIRELKNKLSFYLQQVQEGKRIEVTNRGELVALLIPANWRRVDGELLALVEEGMASWSGGKPAGSPRPVKGHGRSLSEIVVEDRR